MKTERTMTLYEFMNSDWYDYDEVEILFYGRWFVIDECQTWYTKQCTWYAVPEGKLYAIIDDHDHLLEGYQTKYQFRITVDDEDIDNPHVPEDDFVGPTQPSTSFHTKLATVKLNVFALEVWTSYFEGNYIFCLKQRLINGTEQVLDTFVTTGNPELLELYDGDSGWNQDELSIFWESLSVCPQ